MSPAPTQPPAATFLTEISSSSQPKRSPSPSSSSKKRRSSSLVKRHPPSLKDVKLESSQDIPMMLAGIVASERRRHRSPSSFQTKRTTPGGAGAVQTAKPSSTHTSSSNQNLSSLLQYFSNDASDAASGMAYHKRIRGVPLKTQTTRNAMVPYQPLSRPQDKTLYRIEDIRDKNLSVEDKKVIERERMARVMERQREAKQMKHKIVGNVDMGKVVGRDEHFYSRFISPSAYERIKLMDEEKEVAKKKKESSHMTPFAWQEDSMEHNGSIYLFESNQDHASMSPSKKQHQKDKDPLHESYLRELEFNPEKPRTVPGHVQFNKKVSRDSHFYTKFLYREPNEEKNDRWTHVSSTCVFDPKRAKVDPLLNQGNTLNFSRMSERKPLQHVHYDTDYDPTPVLPHSSHADFTNSTGRNVAAPFMAQRKITYTPGEYDPKESSVRGKVRGGKWSKSIARPKPRLASGELYHYDRILKRLEERKRKERRGKRKNVITDDDLRRGLTFA